jgi:hypothetical protein
MKRFIGRERLECPAPPRPFASVPQNETAPPDASGRAVRDWCIALLGLTSHARKPTDDDKSAEGVAKEEDAAMHDCQYIRERNVVKRFVIQVNSVYDSPTLVTFREDPFVAI